MYDRYTAELEVKKLVCENTVFVTNPIKSS